MVTSLITNANVECEVSKEKGNSGNKSLGEGDDDGASQGRVPSRRCRVQRRNAPARIEWSVDQTRAQSKVNEQVANVTVPPTSCSC